MAKFKLLFRTGALAGMDETFSTDEVLIGRDPIHPLTIDDVKVSRDHARIFCEGEQLFIEDLGSTNGTFINGKRVSKPAQLRSGDLVSLGENNVFEFSIIEPYPVTQEENQGQEEEKARIHPQTPVEKAPKPAEPVLKAEKVRRKPALEFFSTMPNWAVILFLAVGFFILFCLIPFVVIEVTDQWCNLFSGFFNSISPGVCP
jgi:pSer/pThr/pTyr-binding forkhead associated (FHA) protein